MGVFSSVVQEKMGRYSREPDNPTKSCKARGSNLCVHFKNTREAANTIKRMPLRRAIAFLQERHSKERVRALPSLQRWCWSMRPGQTMGNDPGTLAQEVSRVPSATSQECRIQC